MWGKAVMDHTTEKLLSLAKERLISGEDEAGELFTIEFKGESMKFMVTEHSEAAIEILPSAE